MPNEDKNTILKVILLLAILFGLVAWMLGGIDVSCMGGKITGRILCLDKNK